MQLWIIKTKNYDKMSRILLSIAFFILAQCAFSQTTHTQRFYVGTFTSESSPGIYLCEFNPETENIVELKSFYGIDNPSFLKISPNREFLYAVSRPAVQVEESGGYVVAYKINQDGSLKFLNKQKSNGGDPCHVDVSGDGRFVAIATYSGGTVSLYPVSDEGKLLPAASVIVSEGAGLDKTRQSKPHAHSIKFSPFSNRVFSADLGTDQIDIFTLKEGKLVQEGQQFMKTEPGAGPRHFVFHPDGQTIYVINELNSTLTSFTLKGENWTKEQTISTLPTGFEGKSYCADIHLSADGRFLYGSNRGHNSIVVFSVDDNSKKLKTVSFVPVEGNWPRNFGLTPDGKFMLVANERSDNITVFKLNPETGMPTFTGNQISLHKPVCIEFF